MYTPLNEVCLQTDKPDERTEENIVSTRTRRTPEDNERRFQRKLDSEISTVKERLKDVFARDVEELEVFF